MLNDPSERMKALCDGPEIAVRSTRAVMGNEVMSVVSGAGLWIKGERGVLG